MSSSSSSSSSSIIPRAAVSTLVRCVPTTKGRPLEPDAEEEGNAKYLLIQRGKAPNKGIWSLPGGKIEYGETALQAAARELSEETKGPDNVSSWANTLQWHETPICATDFIGEGFHYLIAQCFAQIHANDPPVLQSADDAASAAWFTKQEIQAKTEDEDISPGVIDVVEHAENLLKAGLLPTTVSSQ